MSYRRDDTDYPAAWLFAELAKHFDREQVFKDVDSIELGDDFVEVITSAVASCDVLLALIGRRWLTVTGQDGRRRLDNPDDFVRLEIEAALTRDVRVIPILVEGARMPRADELPTSLAKLARRQALELSPSRFGLDAQRLLRTLDRTLAEGQGQSRQQPGRASQSQQQVEPPSETDSAASSVPSAAAPGRIASSEVHANFETPAPPSRGDRINVRTSRQCAKSRIPYLIVWARHLRNPTRHQALIQGQLTGSSKLTGIGFLLYYCACSAGGCGA